MAETDTADVVNDVVEVETETQAAPEIERRMTMMQTAAATPVIKEGELTKMSAGTIKNWRKRYFVVTRDTIAYYSKKGGDVKGGILMETARKVRLAEPSEGGKRQNCFVIETVDRNFVQQVGSAEEAAEWVSAIAEVISSFAAKAEDGQATVTTSGGDASQNETVNESAADAVAKPPAILTYWDGRGNAEVIRIMLAATGEKWVDQVYGNENAPHVTSREEMDTIIASGVAAFDQVPLLQIDGLNLCQKYACVMYLARKHKMVGENPEENARCDILVEGLRDWQSSKPAESGRGNYLPKLERALRSNPNGTDFFVGKGITVADIVFFYIGSAVIETDPTIFDEFPLLQSLFSRISETERISAYMKSEHRFPAPGREGYFDRVKASIPWAFGIGDRPAVTAPTWNFKQ